jgi:hypothetical protein
MTETVLDREKENIEIPRNLIAAVSALLMLIALLMSVKLLNWAVDTKLSNTEEVVGSDVTTKIRDQ